MLFDFFVLTFPFSTYGKFCMLQKVGYFACNLVLRLDSNYVAEVRES